MKNSFKIQMAAIQKAASALRQAEQAADKRMWDKRVALLTAGKKVTYKL